MPLTFEDEGGKETESSHFILSPPKREPRTMPAHPKEQRRRQHARASVCGMKFSVSFVGD